MYVKRGHPQLSDESAASQGYWFWQWPRVCREDGVISGSKISQKDSEQWVWKNQNEHMEIKGRQNFQHCSSERSAHIRMVWIPFKTLLVVWIFPFSCNAVLMSLLLWNWSAKHGAAYFVRIMLGQVPDAAHSVLIMPGQVSGAAQRFWCHCVACWGMFDLCFVQKSIHYQVSVSPNGRFHDKKKLERCNLWDATEVTSFLELLVTAARGNQTEK